MPWLSWIHPLAFLVAILLSDQVSTLTFEPVAVPLAVKTPFLNTWLAGGTNSAPLSRSWSQNGHDRKITGWEGLARVDGVGYSFLGDGAIPTGFVGIQGDIRSITITATQSQFIVRCGPVDLNVTFLSPIEPNDFMRMSLPFSYMSVTASPNDGQRHNVQIYSDITGEFLTGDASAGMTWQTQRTGGIVYHSFTLSTPVQYGQTDGRAQYGTGYHGILYDDSVTYQVTDDVSLRGWFNKTGAMNNTQDNNFRPINQNWPCFALVKDLGNITSASNPVVFAVGLSRDPAIEYQTPAGAQGRSLYYRTQFGTDQDALAFFLNDYNSAVASAAQFDARVASAGGQINGNYADIITLAARQAFSHVEITVSTGTDGQLNSTDTLAFMGIDGVNRIENIYASAPFWTWTNPQVLRLLIEPIIQWHRRVAGSSSAIPYVIGDIGDTYPQATGPSSALQNPRSLESTADMMLITSALVRVSGDASVVAENMDLYSAWAEYLKSNAQNPGGQATTDGTVIGDPNNDSNLAAKAIIALKAYGDLLSSINKDGSTYSNAATSYASYWLTNAVSASGVNAAYQSTGTWTSAYNLFADKWLKTTLFPDDLYRALSSFYSSHLGTFGLPLNSNTTYTNSEWQIFAAGLVPDGTTRDALISKVENYIQNGPNQAPWASMYGASDGNATAPSYFDKPNVGGVYALLVRDMAIVNNPSTTGDNNQSGALSIASYLSTIPYLTATFIVVLSLYGL